MYPKFYTQAATSHLELQDFGPEGWTQKNYVVDNSKVNFYRKVLKFADGYFIHETEIIEGNVRMEATHGKGRLQIGFYQSEQYRYLGIPGENIGDIISIVSYDQCQWEAMVKSPAIGITINFDPEMATKLIDSELEQILRKKSSFDDGYRGILFRMPKFAQGFRTYLQDVLYMAENEHGSGADLTNQSEKYQKFSQDFIQESIGFLQQVITDEEVNPSLGEKQRYNLVKSIEALLWNEPVENSDEFITLDLVAKKLGTSRRTIQSSLQEQIGCGFLELKRSIRLQQLHTALLRQGGNAIIGQLAADYEFFHLGRMAQYYRDFFGETPTETLKKLK